MGAGVDAIELERIYRECGPGVWAYLRGRSATLHDAEELFQETFLIAASDNAALRQANSQRAWLFGIARNLVREHRRRTGRRRRR